LHNSQDEVSRQEDVPFQKDASSTNSMQKNFHIAKRCKAIREDSFFERQIPSMQFYCKTQKCEPLHNSQDKVPRQIDVPLQEDASSTNSIQKNFHIYNPLQTHFPTQPNLSIHKQKRLMRGQNFVHTKF
jgi:hypothetical protein